MFYYVLLHFIYLYTFTFVMLNYLIVFFCVEFKWLKSQIFILWIYFE